MDNYKKYMLECEEYVDRGTDSTDPDAWEQRTYYFDTEKEMVDFVKSKWDFLFKIMAAFKLDKLSNNIFV